MCLLRKVFKSAVTSVSFAAKYTPHLIALRLNRTSASYSRVETLCLSYLFALLPYRSNIACFWRNLNFSLNYSENIHSRFWFCSEEFVAVMVPYHSHIFINNYNYIQLICFFVRIKSKCHNRIFRTARRCKEFGHA